MVFSSLEFIFIFLPAFFIVYASIPKKYKNAVIFLGSMIFYSFGVKKTVYIVLFLLTILFNFIVAQFMEKEQKRKRKLWLAFGVFFNFWWLIFFKYWGFGTENLNALFDTGFTIKDIILPIGISFYTFQNVSYIADVYRGKVKAETSFINYGAYISMFPQLIAGPIVTYGTVADQLKERTHHIKNVENGLKTFTIGLGYKVLIANQISGLWLEITKIGFESISSPLAWMGIFAYSFQLYFDFCGYSLMAVGLGEIMGFRLPKNFDHPYISQTVTEFWRRWHITLGTWFKENIYIPLGGNRSGKLKMLRNTVIVWLFTGLWHGASWNFVIWGAVLCALLIIEKLFIGRFMNSHFFISHAYMLLVIPLTWLIFAVNDLEQLKVYFTRLLPVLHDKSTVIFKEDYIKYFRIYGKYLAVGVIFSTPLPEAIYKKFKDSIVCSFLLLAVFWASVYCIFKGMDDPFMYFRF